MSISPQLPPDGREREIFVRALRSFSDSCVDPDLHPDCPFSVPTATGWGCGEECLDLLATYDPDPDLDEIRLVDGISLVPRRARRSRRGPGTGSKAFDAREAWLRDQDEVDRGKWATSSLVLDLLQGLCEAPPPDPGVGHRVSRIKFVWEEMERRGFDVDRLVRAGLAPNVSLVIAMNIFMGEARDAEELGADPDILSGWADLLRLEVPDLLTADGEPSQEAWMAALQGQFHAGLIAWLATAREEDIVAWTPPTTVEFDAAIASSPPYLEDEIAPSRWLIDRFTQTYPADWSLSSLKLEWQYLHGERSAPCSRPAMRSRQVDKNQLAQAIATRSMDQQSAGLGEPTADALVPRAIALLEQGKRRAAAGLFEVARVLVPNDPSVHNNYGFCLLPDDPQRALQAFDRAMELGRRDTILVANQVCALGRLGRWASALERAQLVVDEWEMVPRRSAWMWEPSSSYAEEPKLVLQDDVRLYVLRLALTVAEWSGDADHIARWRSISERLS